MTNLPRVLLAAPRSGAGKTTVTCAVLQALRNRGLSVASFKCGPDYIDPMFHSEVIGAKSRNLDLYLCPEGTVRWLFQRSAMGQDFSLMEGVMGFYDGVGGSTAQASSYHLAQVTDTPVVLVVNVRGMSLSAAALVKGFAELRPDSRVRGVLFNQCSPMSYPMLRRAVETETGLPVLGYLPKMEDCSLESRHLGLVTAEEVQDLRQKLQRLAAQAEHTVDLDGLLRLGREAPELFARLPELPPQLESPVRVGVARDRAFCFYYEDALELLREMGADLVPFSPMRDKALPENLCGLLLGGGYPEVYAEELAANEPMRRSVRRALEAGMPCIAECGGFLYLHRTLEDQDGVERPMVGLLDAAARNQHRLCRFGYSELTAQEDTMLLKKGERLPVHEFHYWDSQRNGSSCTAEKPVSGRRWECVCGSGTLWAGFPHLHFWGKPEIAHRFLQACVEYEGKAGRTR